MGDQGAIASCSCVCVMISCFYLVIFIKILKLIQNYGKGPIFDRSEHLVLLANFFNYLEGICNIISGAIYYIDENNVTEKLTFPVIFALFFTRLYAIIMGLRSYRIVILYNYRCGNISEAYMHSHSSLKKMLIISLIYSIIAILPVVILKSSNGMHEKSLENYNMSLYGLESIIFCFNLVLIFKSNTHPTILTENLIYTLTWMTGVFSIESFFQLRWLIGIPARNACLLLVAYISLYHHSNLIRPPLPHEPTLLDIYQIKELYSDFYNFLDECEQNDLKEVCALGKELETAQFCSRIEHFINEVELFPRIKYNLNSLIMDEDYDAIQDNIESFLAPYANNYLNSARFEKFKRFYIIYYN